MWQSKEDKDINIWDRIGMGLYAAGGNDPIEARNKTQEINFKKQQMLKEQKAQEAFNNFISGGGMSNGMGVTGATMDDTGKKSLTFGQLPEAKSKQEVKTQVAKDAMGRVQKLQELIPVLDQFDGYLNAIPVDTGMAGRMQGLGLAASKPFQSDPYVVTAMTQLDALRPQIARGFGDVGNLSTAEQKTAKMFIQQVADSADTRVLKGLGGLTFIRKKIVSASEKAGLQDDANYQQVIGELDKRIQGQYNKAMTLGMDTKRMDKFLGVAGVGKNDIPLQVSKETAMALLKEAGGDKVKARELAKSRGFKF